MSQIEDIFNIDNYAGIYLKDIMPKYISNIKNISNKIEEPNIIKVAIDTYIRLLEYYEKASDTNSNSINSALSYCQNIQTSLLKYVEKKYPNYNIELSLKGRIKSIYSATKKFSQKIYEILKMNISDEEKKVKLNNLNINDIFAFKIIITVKDKENNILDDSISIPICYNLTNQIFKIIETNNNIISIPSKERSDKNVPIVHPNVIKPKSQPDFIIELENQKKLKDYIYYPKRTSNYQAIHSKFKINSNTNPLFLEVQIKSINMDNQAEHGPASHKNYKTRNTLGFTRVPQFFSIDSNNNINLYGIEKSFEEFYGITLGSISNNLSIEYLENFFEETNYQYPIGLLEIEYSKDGKIKLLNSDSTTKAITIDSISDDENIEAIVLDVFSKSKNILIK